MTNKEALIEFENFGFKYNAQKKPTLKNINLTINRGEKVLIAGVSGCGKSTLAHCINGLIPFSYKGEITGSLKIKGKETKDLSLFDISKHVGTVLQDSDAQFVGLTVAEDIAFALENDCVGEPELHERVLKAAKMVEIEKFLKAAPRELSGGQKQRVSVAGVMISNVDVFIFDEPLANLDPATGKQAVELIDDITNKTDASVIIIEHRIEDVLHKNVDRIILMSDGEIIADTTPDELLTTDLLKSNGIREPLYVTALKYAKTHITESMHPSNAKSLIIDAQTSDRVRDFFSGYHSDGKRTDNKELLSITNLDFSYIKERGKVLKNINLRIYEGEMLAIVGTNGAGKSTLAKVICGLQDDASGSIVFDGIDFNELSIKERAEHVGYVMQNPNQMISKIMIFDEVALGLRCRGISEDIVEEKVLKVLKICGLYKYRNWPISALSYGQKKRVTIASILVLEPQMLILDEPTAGQDYAHYTEIMSFLEELNKQGITIVMITHDMHLMLEYADRAIVFSNGTIIADGRCSDILTDIDITNRASLKMTSLYDLAMKCNIDNKEEFVEAFINYERTAIRTMKDESNLSEGGQND